MADQVAIIGSGFAGLCMAIRLKQAGIHSFTVYERALDIGGVWRDNTYPGAGSDVASHLYCYSFEQSFGWSRSFPRQEEMLRYLQHCVEKYGLRPHIRFGVEVVGARYDEVAKRWELEDAHGGLHQARTLVPALGQLSKPKIPEDLSMQDFTGVVFHSSEWKHDHDLTGKNVGVIGTGASAVQLIPEIAAKVGKLSVFQRSATWILPKFEYRFGRAHQTMFKTRAGRMFFRGAWFVFGDFVAYSAIRGGRIGKILGYLCSWQLRRQIQDPELRDKLTPEFPAGCKRVALSDTYYPALARNNVELITEKIVQVTAHGVVTADGVEHEVDTLICASGFMGTEFLAPMEITGRNGVRLREDAWAEGASAYLGMAVPKFPNLFILYGPNTNLGSTSVLLMIEAQVRYTVKCLLLMESRGHEEMEVSTQAFQAYQDELEKSLEGTVWAAGCSSWYKTESGKIVSNWPKRVLRYRRETKLPRLEHFLVD